MGGANEKGDRVVCPSCGHEFVRGEQLSEQSGSIGLPASHPHAQSCWLYSPKPGVQYIPVSLYYNEFTSRTLAIDHAGNSVVLAFDGGYAAFTQPIEFDDGSTLIPPKPEPLTK